MNRDDIIHMAREAWINYCAATGRKTIDRACYSELASTPLYEAPPQRKPLTEEEIDQNLRCAVYMAMRELKEEYLK